MPLRRVSWTYSAPPEYSATHIPSIFQAWHRARKLNLEVLDLRLASRLVPRESLFRLNLWLSGSGAWPCSILSHFEAERVLQRVLAQDVTSLPGPNSAGRWLQSAKAEEVLRAAG